MDFFQIKTRTPKKGELEVYPDYKVCKSKDLMVRGKAFYAIWDEEKKMWSTDEYDVQRLIDKELRDYTKKLPQTEDRVSVKYTESFSSTSWLSFQKYVKNLSDNSHQLDEKITFSNTETTKQDYVSKRLGYSLSDGECKAWDEIVSTLYEDEEKEKIEWAIGAIVSGDAKTIQKFLVFYGDPGAGKGTILKIIKKLFNGYCETFEAKAITSATNNFSTEMFRSNPLVAIQEDGDLSKIDDNSTLNSIVSHEDVIIKEKYKPGYSARINSFLFMASNKPVKITDAKSGIIRRLIDVHPKPLKEAGVSPIPAKKYLALMSQIDFELGAIAKHCLDIYRKLGKNYYSAYRPIDMMFKTDVFFNFVEDNYLTFADQDGTTLKAAYEVYKDYCEESGSEGYRLPRYKFREELKNYFKNFEEIARVDGKQVRSWFSGFQKDKFKNRDISEDKQETALPMVLDETDSLLDILLAEEPAQYATSNETPSFKWAEVKTKLKDLDTKRVHYVKVPENHIVIDFDIRDEQGNKNALLNLEAASKWPPTYAEFSKGGGGIHLHYWYNGDAKKLERTYAPGIEVKVFTGGASLRRRVSKCNSIPVATISEGLKEKGEKMTTSKTIEDEKHLRSLILKAVRKETDCGGTKSNVEFIKKLLEEAHDSGMKYDVSDLYQKVLVFANNSTNHSKYCAMLVGKMQFKSDEPSSSIDAHEGEMAFFDVEVFPNLCLVVWKYAGPDAKPVRMFNPSPEAVKPLLAMKLVGFNCREYDNHILRALLDGYSPKEIYNVSQNIIANKPGAITWEAKNYSYTDVYDFCSKKQSLKKWEIELGIFHKELGMRWDQPVPEDKWELVAQYCENDVVATEAVFNARQADWTARKMLASIAGGSVNDSTNNLSQKFVFEDDQNPQTKFNYRNLGEVKDRETYTMPWNLRSGDPDKFTLFGPDGLPVFPGYSFEHRKKKVMLKDEEGNETEQYVETSEMVSLYRDEEVGEGGYVYAEPGVYGNVALLDIASMHPSSIIAEQLFGPKYTKRFQEIRDARVAIKHGDFEKARKMLDGKLAPFLDDESNAKGLAGALKIVINAVYGQTGAGYKNRFRDPRNKDNIVAKRGALFMVNLKHMVQDAGFTVAHIKTDSIKIPDATPEIIQKVKDYGKLYGYSFEHEATYEKMCLVNDAVYIAFGKSGDHAGEWTATGAQFQHPYVFKKLFSKEPITFQDVCETKSVKTAIYLNFNEDGVDSYHFVGKVGSFVPVRDGCGGGLLMREQSEGKYGAVTGTKGYRWKEAEIVKSTASFDDVNYGYFDTLVEKAQAAIREYTDDLEWFCSTAPYVPLHPREEDVNPPWYEGTLCGDGQYKSCWECPKFHPMDSSDPADYLASTCDAGYSIEQIYTMAEEPNERKN